MNPGTPIVYFTRNVFKIPLHFQHLKKIWYKSGTVYKTKTIGNDPKTWLTKTYVINKFQQPNYFLVKVIGQ